MKHLFLISLFIFFAGAANESYGQTVVAAKKYNAKGAGARLQLPTTDLEAPKPDPTRGLCCLDFDNYTGYYLYVWVDDVYQGTVAPWAEGEVCVADGWTTYYVRTAGSNYEWSASGQCTGDYILDIIE